MGNALYVINPAGHGGAGLAVWEKFKSLWSDPIDPGDVIVTEKPGQARGLAASSDDWETLVAVGGDGTANEMIAGVLSRPDDRPRLAIIPAGTGNDIARNVGVHSIEDSVAALRAAEDRSYDVVRVHWVAQGVPQDGCAFLQGIVGFSGVPGIKPWMKRLFGPTVAYRLGSMVQVFKYKAPHMTIETDGRHYSGPAWMLIVGNAEWASGGSMCLSPGARTDDGDLNITVIPYEKSKLGMALNMGPKIATGEHVQLPEVEYFKATQVEVQSSPAAILDLDGDIVGTTPATFAVCPQAVRIISLRKAI